MGCILPETAKERIGSNDLISNLWPQMKEEKKKENFQPKTSQVSIHTLKLEAFYLHNYCSHYSNQNALDSELDLEVNPSVCLITSCLLCWVHKCIHTDKYGNIQSTVSAWMTSSYWTKSWVQKSWTLFTVTGRHLGYITEADGTHPTLWKWWLQLVIPASDEGLLG